MHRNLHLARHGRLFRLAVLVAAALALGPPSRALAAAAPVAKWCSGVAIAAFPGGPKADAFAATVEGGFRQAEADLGPSVTYYFSDWNPNTLLTQITQALAAKTDGIAAYGMAGDAATARFADRLFASGGVFTTLNLPLPKAQARYGARGFGYAGAPNFNAGAALAGQTIARAGLVKGDFVLVWGVKGKGGERAQRSLGVLDAFARAGIKAVYQEIDAASLASANAATTAFIALMKANPLIKAVILDNGGLTEAAATLAKAAGLEPGKMFFAGFDLTAASAKAVADGYLSVVLDQQPYLQGYLSILDICLAKKFGFQGLDVMTTGAFIDKSNVEAVAALIAKGIR